MRRLNQLYRFHGHLYRRTASSIPSWDEFVQHLQERWSGPDFDGMLNQDGTVEESILSSIEEDYVAAIELIPTLDGRDCWRALKLPTRSTRRPSDDATPPEMTEKDVVNLSPLGTYWSYTQAGAVPYWGEGRYGATQPQKSAEQVVVYQAVISSGALDIFNTVIQNAINPEETEVRLLPDTRIWVEEVTLANGLVLEIQDWRWT